MLTLRAMVLVTGLMTGLPVSSSPSADLSPGMSGTGLGNIALINGAVYTVNPQQPWAEAVVIRDKKIVFVGDSDEAAKHIGDHMEVVNLQGKMVLPGIHDTHLHPLEAGSDRVKCLLDTEQTMTTMHRVIRQCAKQHPGSDWLLGWGHTLETLLESPKSPRQWLDEIDRQRPIAIMEATSHSVWVNSKALELAGIERNSPAPKGGVIMRDAQGEPNGILLDAAGDLVFDVAYTPTPALMQSNYEGLLYGLEQVASHGITSIVDARIYWQRGYLKAWQRAEAEGTLTARTVLSLWAYPSLDDQRQLATLKSMFRDDPDRLLRVNQVKLYSDGILHNTTAALEKPYLDYIEEVGAYGLNYFDAPRLQRYVTELEKVGFSMHIHAIGDRAVRESLDAIAHARSVNGITEPRHRLTHVEMVNSRDKARFAELDVIADFQLAGDFSRPENHEWMAPLIGDRAFEMLPVRDIFDTGAVVTLSSDWDVSSLSPFVGMQNALTQGAQSLPDLHAVIQAYTINGAYTMRQEKQTGSLEVGKLGDLIVLDQNLFDVPAAQIGSTRVTLTVLGGQVVYDASR